MPPKKKSGALDSNGTRRDNEKASFETYHMLLKKRQVSINEKTIQIQQNFVSYSTSEVINNERYVSYVVSCGYVYGMVWYGMAWYGMA